jgi:molybdopterin-guanine dinucleotide biosynthesis protein MobB
MTATIPIVSIVGRSGSGKTTLVEKLIRELRRRGHRLAVIKHHHHPDFEFDVPGKDSYRFAQAGADHVVIAGPTKVVHICQYRSEPTIDEVTASIHDVDLIITEGYKRASTPKIEVSRSGQGRAEIGSMGTGEGLVSDPGQLIALVSDRRFDLPVPQFDLGDVAALADFVETRFLRSA